MTLRVAGVSTLLVIVPAALLGYWLARHRFRGQVLFSGLIMLPMVLPPTAVGYLLLSLFSDSGPLGINIDLLLTWKAAVLASSVMAFPVVLRTTRVAFEAVDPRLEAMSHTLGRGTVRTFLSVSVPLAKRGLLASAILGFMRSVGEFGATVIVAGNIPGRTQTLATAIYSAQQAADDRGAFLLIGLALVVGLLSATFAESLVSSTGKTA